MRYGRKKEDEIDDKVVMLRRSAVVSGRSQKELQQVVRWMMEGVIFHAQVRYLLKKVIRDLGLKEGMK